MKKLLFIHRSFSVSALLSSIAFVWFANTKAQMVTDTFSFTGSQQIFVVPAGVDSLQIDVRGAQGDSGTGTFYDIGGLGGRVNGKIGVTPNTTIYILVGSSSGYNGGGVGDHYGGNGGGATDLRMGGTELSNRIVVAGGGGGGGNGGGKDGGSGGGLTGGNSVCNCQQNGGSQALGGMGCFGGSNGSLGIGGNAGTIYFHGGGGGGGLFGGGGGGYDVNGSCVSIGGGGGSSLVPTGCCTTAGYWSGDGMVIISYSVCNLSIAISTTNAACNNNNGTATASVIGGTSPYSYQWNIGDTTSSVSGLPSSVYSVTVTDSNNCTATANATVVVNPPGAWTQKANFGGTPRSGPVAFSIGTKGYFGTGADSIQAFKDFWEWDPSTNIWTQKSDFGGVVRSGATGFSIGTKGYIISGDTTTNSTGLLNDTWEWDQVTNTWLQKTNLIGTSRYSAVGFSIGNKGYLGTGHDGAFKNDFYEFDPSGGSLSASISKTDISCNGANDGTATIILTGGFPPYSYLWSNGDTTSQISNLTSQIYTVTVTDTSGCTAIATVTISEPAFLATYTDTIAKIIYDSRNCRQYPIEKIGNQWWMKENLDVGIMITSTTGGQLQTNNGIIEKYCYNNNQAYCDTFGGLYEWNEAMNYSPSDSGNPGITQGICPTGWSFPTDAEWCVLEFFLDSTIDAGCSLTGLRGTDIGDKLKSNANWNGTNASGFSAIPAGYRSWLDGTFYDLGTHATFNISTEYNSANAWYRDLYSGSNKSERDNGGKSGGHLIRCLKTSISPIAITISSTNVSCNGGSDGSTTASASGGILPYSFLWSTGDTTSSVSGLPSSVYLITVIDANNSTITDSVTITEPSAISTYATATICSNDSILLQGNYQTTADIYYDTLTAVNGCDSILETTLTVNQYSISNTQYSICSGDSIFVGGNYQSIAGTYYDTLTSVNGCDSVITTTLTILQNSSSVLNETACDSFTLNSQTYTSSGIYTQTLTYTAGCDSTITLNLTVNSTATATAIAAICSGDSIFLQGNYQTTAGTYYDTLQTINGCDSVISTSLTINTNPIPAITPSGSTTFCQGNTIQLTATAASAYLWSEGSTSQTISVSTSGAYDVTVTNANGCTGSAVTSTSITVNPNPSPTISGAASVCSSGSGTYSVTNNSGNTYSWTISNGTINSGQGTNSVSVTWNSSGTASISVTETNSSTNCSDSNTLNISILQSTSSVLNETACDSYMLNSQTYSVSGTYSQTLTNADGCDSIITLNLTINQSSSNNQQSSICSGDSILLQGNYQTTAGIYYDTITSVNGCDSIIVTTLAVNVISVSISSTDASCYGCSDGTATANVSGGNSPFTYLWSDNQTSQTATGLAAGNYYVTVTDGNGCTGTATATISQPLCNLTISLSSNNVICNGAATGSATVAPNGGTSPFTYQWSNGGTTSTIQNLTANYYSVTVTDVNGCSAMASVTITQPAALSVSATTTAATCGISNGSALANTTGGIAPYLYQWSSGDSTAFADSLVSGIYMVTVTDVNGCNNFSPVIINNTGAPIISVNSITNVSCSGGNNGSIDISVSGGSTPYTYSWSNGSTTQDLSNLAMSPYEIIVTGANGCTSAQSIFVSQPAVLSATSAGNSASCGGNDGSAIVTPSGGSSPYTYLWSNGPTTAQISNLTSQIYYVTVTDNNGCVKTASAAIGETGGATVQVDSVIQAGCGGGGSIYVILTGGTSPYSYSWTNSTTTQNLINAAAGNYGLIVTDSNGCSGAVSASIPFQQIMFDPICLITVDTVTEANKLVWEKTYGMGISYYKIYKEQSIAGIYQWVGTVPFANLSVFNDSVANPLIRSWRYKLSAVDSCGNESVLSPEHKTMHLTVNSGLANSYNLIWDHYEGFQYGTYYIWRYKQNTGWVLKDSIPSNLNSWSDYTPPTPFNLRYFVEVKHPDGCFATKSTENHNSSRTNKTYPIAPAPPALNTSSTVIDATQGNCDGEATVSVNGGITPYTYLWNTNPAQTTATATGLCAGNYQVTVTDSESDTAMLNVTVGTAISIQSQYSNPNANISIYPNPVKNEMTLAITLPSAEKVNVIIINTLGQETQLLASKVEKGKNIFNFNTEELSTGVYYLQIMIGESKPEYVKFVKAQ